MAVEPYRIVADYLSAHLAAVLAAVPLDAEDVAAGYTIPAVAAVVDRTRCGWLARRSVPREGLAFPVLAVTSPAAIGERAAMYEPSRKTIAGTSGAKVQDGRVALAILYLTQAELTEQGVRDAAYTLRAVRGCLWQLADAPSAERTRNGVQLVLPVACAEIDDVATVGDVPCAGATIVTFTTRETTP